MASSSDAPMLPEHHTKTMEVSKEPDMLGGWWTDSKLFSLERRAVFSKVWLCVTHSSRFSKPGDYISMDVAGFPVLIILGKDLVVRAFHNVCRHRAYTVTKKAAGSALVLGCRYHGWSYNTRGNLVKAPHFDGIEGFDKSKNGLFKLRTCTDRGGFVHVNMDATEVTDAPDCNDLIMFAAQNGINSTSKWLESWEIDGNFNWKVAAQGNSNKAQNYSSHRSFASIFDYIPGFRTSTMFSMQYDALDVSPLTMIRVLEGLPLWLTLTILPYSATSCRVKCDIFTVVASFIPAFADVESVKAHVYGLVSFMERQYAILVSNPLTAEPSTLPYLKAHLKLEQLAGREIFPGRREKEMSEACWKAEKVCKELDAMVGLPTVDCRGVKQLDW